MKTTKKAKKVLKLKGISTKDWDINYNVLEILPRFFYKPSNFIKNNLFYLTTSTPSDLKNNILSDLEKELVRQEYKKVYNKTYKLEYDNIYKQIKKVSEKSLAKLYPDALNKAKINYFKELYNSVDSKVVDFITLNLKNINLDDKGELSETATLAYLQREVNANPTFVLEVVKAIEKGEVLNRNPINLQEELAKEYSFIYSPNIQEIVADHLAKEKAEELIFEQYENEPNVLTEKKITAVLDEAKYILEKDLNLKQRFSDGMKSSSPYLVIAQRIEKINKRILGDYKQAIYNDSMGFVENSAFNTIDVTSFENRNLTKKYQPVDFPFIMNKYSNDILEIMENNHAIEKLERDINSIKKVNAKLASDNYEYLDKQEKLRLYKTANELIYNKIEINEMQNAVKNITNEFGVEIVEADIELLNDKRKQAALKSISLFVDNLPKDFEVKLRKSMKMRADKFEKIDYETLLNGIKFFIVENNKSNLTKSQKLEKAEETIKKLNTYVEDYKNLPAVNSDKYLNQLNKIKLELAVKRFAELSKSANDLTVLSRIYDTQLKQLKNNNLGIKVRQDKVLDAKFIQVEIDKVYKDIDDILKTYSNNERKLKTFVYEFVQGIRVEIANTPSPKVKRNLLNAYAEPLLRSNIIKNSSELTTIVENLAKRENFFFMKTDEELATHKDIAKVHSQITNNLVDRLEINVANKKDANLGLAKHDLITLNKNALRFGTLEVLKDKLLRFDKLIARDKIEVLNNIEIENNIVKTKSPINYSRFVLNPKGLEGEVKEALGIARKSINELIYKYENASQQDKINFLILSMHRENTAKTMRMRANKPERAKVLKAYSFKTEEDVHNFKEDLFWKLQYMAVERKNRANKLMTSSSQYVQETTEIVVKLLDVASNGIQGVKEKDEVVNLKELARKSLLTYKNSKNKVESSVVNYLLDDSYNYYNTQEFNRVVSNIINTKEIAKKLQSGVLTLEELIANESKGKKGLLTSAMQEILDKTSNTQPKEKQA